jgi:hypothetical protein
MRFWNRADLFCHVGPEENVFARILGPMHTTIILAMGTCFPNGDRVTGLISPGSVRVNERPDDTVV